MAFLLLLLPLGEIRHNLFQETGFGLAIGGTSQPRIIENKIIQNRDGLFISDEAHPMLRNNVIETMCVVEL